MHQPGFPADMMIDLIKGKSVDEAMRLVDLFLDMIKREITDDEQLEELEDAIVEKYLQYAGTGSNAQYWLAYY